MSGNADSKPTAANPKTATASRRRKQRPPRDNQPTDPAVLNLLEAEDGDGVDYAPALVAVDDLAGWAFDLAAKDVDGWPEGKRRVRNARRYVHAVLRGKRTPKKPREDLLFTAALLARVFDAEVGLGLDHVAEILGELALPTDHAPTEVRRPSVKAPPIAPSAWRHVRSIYHSLPAAHAEEARDQAMRLSTSQRDGWIAALTQLPVDEAAHLVLAYLGGAVPAPQPMTPGAVASMNRPSFIAEHPTRTPQPHACAGCGGVAPGFRKVA